jgi:hypothetical protein
MLEVQELLNKEANLANRRYLLHKQIKVMRGEIPPHCWGHDDCSTNILLQCPWRIDCDSHEAQQYQQTLPR